MELFCSHSEDHAVYLAIKRGLDLFWLNEFTS